MKGKIKARRMWAELPKIFTAIPQVFHQSRPLTREPMPVAVIDVSDEAALIEQVHGVIFARHGNLLELGGDGAALSREILTSLGILKAPRKQSKRKGAA